MDFKNELQLLYDNIEKYEMRFIYFVLALQKKKQKSLQ